jgi:hypothetical protein
VKHLLLVYMFKLIAITFLSILCGTTVFSDKITANIQRDLNLLGYNAGPVDGVSGRKTISSLEAFYNDYGGEFDGEIDKNDAEAVRSYAERYSYNRSPSKGLVKDTPKNSWAHRFTSEDSRAGEFSQRMELRNGDCEQYDFIRRVVDKFGCRTDRERAEVISAEWKPGKSTWIGYSVKLDPNMKLDPVNEWQAAGVCTFISQLKVYDQGVNQQKFVNNGNFMGGAPVFFISLCDQKLNAQVVKTEGRSKTNGRAIDLTYLLAYTKNMRNDWLDIVINFDDRGYKQKQTSLRIFVNGEEKVNIQNFREFFPDVYAFKYGFYRSHIKERMGKNYVSANLIAYFDEVRVGSSMEEVMPSLDSPVD